MFYLNKDKVKQALLFIMLLTTTNSRGPILLIWSLERKKNVCGRGAIASLRIQLYRFSSPGCGFMDSHSTFIESVAATVLN